MEEDGPISLETRMFFVVLAYFGGLWLIAAAAGSILGVGSIWIWALWALVFLTLQNLAAPSLLERRLRVAWPGEGDEPRLAAAVERAAFAADIPAPRTGVSSLRMFNAFAFGRTRRDSRICVTKALLDSLSDHELDAVIGHEMSHVKSFDLTVLSLLAVAPALSGAIVAVPDVVASWTGSLLARVCFRLLAFVVAPVVWLLWILMIPVNMLSIMLLNYGSRVRELSADRQTVRMGYEARVLASALFKIAGAPADVDDASRVGASRALMLEPRAGGLEEIMFLRHLDADESGDISGDEFERLHEGRLSISLSQRVKEVFSSHPLVAKRFKRLADMS